MSNELHVSFRLINSNVFMFFVSDHGDLPMHESDHLCNQSARPISKPTTSGPIFNPKPIGVEFFYVRIKFQHSVIKQIINRFSLPDMRARNPLNDLQYPRRFGQLAMLMASQPHHTMHVVLLTSQRMWSDCCSIPRNIGGMWLAVKPSKRQVVSEPTSSTFY